MIRLYPCTAFVNARLGGRGEGNDEGSTGGGGALLYESRRN